MPGIAGQRKQQEQVKQRSTKNSWRKRLSQKAKKLSKRIRKAFKCKVACTSGEKDTPLPTPLPEDEPVFFASSSTQTEIPQIVDQLRHGGETMTHRQSSSLNLNNSNNNGKCVWSYSSSSTSSRKSRRKFVLRLHFLCFF